MKITRRQFLKGALATGVALSLPLKFGVRSAHAFYQSPGIPLFGTDLRGLGTIPVAAPDAFAAPVTGVTHYTININEFFDQITPASTGLLPTTLWGYQPVNPLLPSVSTQRHLGGIIVGQKGNPIQITFKNNLPPIHPLPVDTTIPGASLGPNRAAVHLHGGLVPWISDGGPFDWFDPVGGHGLSFFNNDVLNPDALPGQAEYYYPLNQSARFMWYHDHAVGITRLNAYIGIASGMLIRDNHENSLIAKGMPNYIELGGNELPIVIQDKIFVGNDIGTSDPDWEGSSTPGSLWYAHTYDPTRWTAGPDFFNPPEPSAIPEFFGDTMLVNGTTFPEATVQARRYRLRLLNACNARFLNLQLYIADSSLNGITLNGSGNPTNPPFVNAATGNSTWLQIGTEGGFLPSPVKVPSNVPISIPPPDGNGSIDPSLVQKSLLVAPAERPDLIVDFSGYAGRSIILYSDAPAPFPVGDPVNDYFPGLNTGDNPVNGLTQPGYGPNSRVLMRFNVVAATGAPDKKLQIDTHTNLIGGIDKPLVPFGVTVPPPGVPTRFLSLNEYFDELGRLIQILGNAAAPFGSPYEGSATYQGYAGANATQSATMENVVAGSTEVWEIYNTTGDVHPMHFHLVNVQVINRQTINPDPAAFSNGSYPTTGPVIPPDPNETGWKETVPMYPGTVTRVIMQFNLPQIVPAKAKGHTIAIPTSTRTGGHEYVWHCHILEHEEHDMMHALVVT